MIWHALLWLVDWRVLALVGVVGAVIIYRMLGWRFSLVAILLAAGAVLYRKGQQGGAASARAQQERADTKAVNTRNEVRSELDGETRDRIKERLDRWATKD